MTDPSASDDDGSTPSRRRVLLGLGLLSVLVVSGAYQVASSSQIRLGSWLLGGPFLAGFHDAEAGFRWTRARSCMTFPDPGPGAPRAETRIELAVSGFRPRGQEPPEAWFELDGETHRVRTPRRYEGITLPAGLEGFWSTDVELCIRSETFTPGPMDQRSLGVRIGSARLAYGSGALHLGLPPLRQVCYAALAVLLVFSTLSLAGFDDRRATAFAVAIAAGLGVAYVTARPYTAVASGPLALLAALSWGVARFFPAAVHFARELASESAPCLGRGLRLGLGWRGAVLAALGAVAVSAAFVARPRLVLDFGSGVEAPLLSRFSGPDGDAGVRFRRALAGAAIDLRDFGGGTTWRVTIRAALPETAAPPEKLTLLRAGGEELAADLGSEWTSSTLVAPAPFGWRSGLRLEIPSASPRAPIRVDRVELERGRALPSLRLAVVLAATGFFFLAALAAAGLGAETSLFAAVLFLGGESFAIFVDPVGWIPMTAVLLQIAVVAFVAAALVAGALRTAERRGFDLPLSPATLAVGVAGFMVWLTAMSFPTYSGRHFVYHSNIAEEIWKGRFLVFYLPHPDNILSREAQWGGLVVPYPCLYHTLVAPLTALPAPWFEFAQKLLQAALLAVMALVASAVAARFGGMRAGLWAGMVAVSLVSSFQLLGLAHFLTVFGCAAAAVALGYVTLFLERLSERTFWWGAVLLLSLAFLSYTASLLFTAFALAMALPFVYAKDRGLGLRLASSTLAAVAVAFFLYYVHWVLPFVRESIPLLLSSEGGGSGKGSFPLLARVAAVPRKLGYSFGSPAIPLAGLAGVGLATLSSSTSPTPRALGRICLAAWAGIVVVFSAFDLFFNFILKHHYFVMVPVAAGCGILLDKLFRSPGTAARLLAVGFLAFALAIGSLAAHQLAAGTIR